MVRLAHLADAAALARIESRSWRSAYASLLPEVRLAELEPEARVSHWRARLRKNGRGRALYVAERPAWSGIPVGYTSVGAADHPDLEPGFAGEVFELYVDPEHQGQGVGTELLDAARDALRQMGFGWMVLEVLADNAGARRFYTARGLATEGRTRRRPSRDSGPGGLRFSQPRSAVQVVRYEASLWELDVSVLRGPARNAT
ncbi:MAG: GNAT family N-acetyltransferase [Myxococcota bacterium]